jgi:D-alanyl-lipoteichoic acid acyltransferase DltB (MBOAT superfamily)
MGLCGLWHGAGWTYVVWGLWHGFGLIVCHGWQQLKRPLPAVIGWAITFLFVIVGWVLFRSSSFVAASTMLASLVGIGGAGGALQGIKLLVASALVSALVPSAHEIMNGLSRPYPALAAGAAVLAVYCLLEVGQGAPVKFIYFQF